MITERKRGKPTMPVCFFCKHRIEYPDHVYAVTTPAGPGFAHTSHAVPEAIRREQNEALPYAAWVDRGLGLE